MVLEPLACRIVLRALEKAASDKGTDVAGLLELHATQEESFLIDLDGVVDSLVDNSND
jgi:hypothetical protein